jgi:NAD(P)-dependent dehydrogenase (short-subunit alcohol dehydrogenase family)/AcrR family transcriptional regulator
MSIIPTTIKNKELVEKRREQIVLAAINLFAKKGFHKATLRELSEVAGISHGSIYDYVGTKEDIFFLLHEFMDKLATDALHRSMENIDDPFEKLRRMVRSEFNLMYQWADAILLIYQECHILDKPLLKRLLKRESAHIRLYEIVLQECIKKGLLLDCNTKAIANLIKAMVDAWVLKRWDLREHVTQSEMERSILDLVFNGLINVKGSKSRDLEGMDPLEGKVILFVNGETVLGEATSSFLLSKGAKVAIYIDGVKGDKDFPALMKKRSEKVHFYSAKEYGPITQNLLRQIVDDFGPLDIVIQDLGIGNVEIRTSDRDMTSAGQRLETNFSCAQDLTKTLETEMNKNGCGRILYLAPWAWDRYADPLRYETVKRGAITLTQTMAKIMAPSRVTVNCIIPGFIRTIRPSMIEKDLGVELMGEIPLGYLGEISNVLTAVSFLISDSSEYLTGQVLEVAGGIN